MWRTTDQKSNNSYVNLLARGIKEVLEKLQGKHLKRACE